MHERFLAAYDFMPRNAVAVVGPDGDAGAMEALLALSPAQLDAKLMDVRCLALAAGHVLSSAPAALSLEFAAAAGSDGGVCAGGAGQGVCCAPQPAGVCCHAGAGESSSLTLCSAGVHRSSRP